MFSNSRRFSTSHRTGEGKAYLVKSSSTGSTTWILVRENDISPSLTLAAPDNSQGNEIMQTREPWDHPSFWPYVTRCLLRGFHLPASSFLRTLSSHPHPPISKLAVLLSTHLSLLPRSHNTTAYPLDHQFLSAHKKWLARFRAEFAAFLGGRGSGRWLEDAKWAGWETDFRTVVELMEGKAERVMEEAADWREAMGAWGVLVDVGLRRDDLPGVMARIVDRIPVDSTVLDDEIQSSLCSGNIVKVRHISSRLPLTNLIGVDPMPRSGCMACCASRRRLRQISYDS